MQWISASRIALSRGELVLLTFTPVNLGIISAIVYVLYFWMRVGLLFTHMLLRIIDVDVVFDVTNSTVLFIILITTYRHHSPVPILLRSNTNTHPITPPH